MGMKSSPQNATNGAIMAVLWFIYRILFFGWLGAGLFRMRSDLMTLKAYQVRVRVCLRVASLKCAMIACRLTFRTCVHIMVCYGVCLCVRVERGDRKKERKRARRRILVSLVIFCHRLDSAGAIAFYVFRFPFNPCLFVILWWRGMVLAEWHHHGNVCDRLLAANLLVQEDRQRRDESTQQERRQELQ